MYPREPPSQHSAAQAQSIASDRIRSHPPLHIISGLKRRPRALLGGHRLGPCWIGWTVTSPSPNAGPTTKQRWCLGRSPVGVGDEVSLSVSSVSGQRTVYYLVPLGLSARLWSVLVWSGVRARGAHPSRPQVENPLTRDPWTSTNPTPPSLHTPIILAARRVPPVFAPSSLFAPLSLSLLGLDLGDPVTRQAFPHIIKRLCFAAFLGLGLCGLLRLHRPGHLHSPNLLA